MSIVGTYAISNSLFDLGLLLFFGLIGYIMRKINFDFATAVLALILGPMAEVNVRRAFLISGGSASILFSTFIDWLIIGLSIMSLSFAFYVFIRNQKIKKPKEN